MMVLPLRARVDIRRNNTENTFFNADYYCREYADVLSSGLDPFQHYMEDGWREGRNPAAGFITLYYRDKHLGGRPINPLTHYVQEGIHAGLQVAPRDEKEYIEVQVPVVLPFFDPSGYSAHADRLGMDALHHYLQYGWRENTRVRLDVNLDSYVEHFNHVKSLRVSPLYHYASQKRLMAWRALAEQTFDGGGTSLGSMASKADERRKVRTALSEAFDQEYYLSRYDDVRRSNKDPIDHFIDIGWREGRRPNLLFDTVFYLRENSEVTESGLNPLYHYLTIGREAGLRPNPVGSRAYPEMVAPQDDDWAGVTPAAALEDCRCVVVMPIYKGYDETLASIYSILMARQDVSFALLVIDDRSPDIALSMKMAQLSSKGLFSRWVNRTNLGFVKSVNSALRSLPDQLIVLINSDTVVSGNWLDRMIAHAENDPLIATVTPFSNSATICSYPLLNENNMIEPEVDVAGLDRLAFDANRGRSSEIPTGVGFCFLMSVAARRSVGLLDEAAFGRGYGEECDFCFRAAKAGFRNVLAEDVFVYHKGEVSFGKPVAGEAPGQKALHVKHPEYPDTIRQHLKANPTEIGRIRLDLRRLAASAKAKPAVIVYHGLTGGIVTHVKEELRRCEDAKVDVILIRVGVEGRWNIEITSGVGAPAFTPNLRVMPFPQFRQHLADFLLWLDAGLIHIHSFVGLNWTSTVELMTLIRDSGTPYHFTLHDYSVVCHRNNLVLANNRYCGLADIERCRLCVATDWNYPEAIDPAVLRATYARFLEGADRVQAPSCDLADRLRGAGARYAIDVEPHAEERLDAPTMRSIVEASVVTVVTIGAIGAHKGSRIILGLARDAKTRNLPIRYHIIGHSDISDAMAEAGVNETGRFLKTEDAMRAVTSLHPQLIFLPSIWPETWSYTLSMSLAFGVMPVVFDIGAPAARIRDEGFGVILPYELVDDIPTLNNRLVELGLRTSADPRDVDMFRDPKLPIRRG